MSEHEIEADVPVHEGKPPSELESLFLSVALVAGLVIFGIGCLMFGWFD